MSFVQIFNLGYRSNYLFAGLLVGLLIGIYTFFRLSKLFDYYNLKKRNSLILRIIISICIFISCYNIQSTITILLTYLFFSSVIADIIRIIHKIIIKISKLSPSKFIQKIHRSGILALIFFILIVSVSVFGMMHVDNTNYNLTTNKTNNSYTILYISDIHYDTIQDPNLLKDKISQLNNLNPDLIILGGDIVDERTSQKSMEEVFSYLGNLNSTYGTYFTFGNHDRQPNVNDYVNSSKPFDNSYLVDVIKKNGIIILADSNVSINEDIEFIAREDVGWNDSVSRKNSSDLLKDVNNSKYIILADHQPIDVELNSKLGVDLQLSGHTHGGQIFPYGFASNLAGKFNYGKYTMGNMTQITSSGYAGWGIPLRNEAKCEYVTIHIN